MIKKLVLCIFVVYPAFLTGCNNINLKDIQGLSKQGVKTSELYPNVVSDLYNSCIRSVEYQENARDQRIVSEDSINPSSNVNTIEGFSDETCIENFKIKSLNSSNFNESNNISKAVFLNNILKNYFESIGNLAGADIALSDDANSLAESVTNLLDGDNLNESTKAEIKAAGQILGFILNIISNNIRANTLRDEIIARDEDIDTIINALIDTITVYKARLSFEENDMNTFYKKAFDSYELARNNIKINNFRENISNSSKEIDIYYPLIKVLIDSQWNQSRNIIREKNNIANDFIKVLKELSKTHSIISIQLSSISEDDYYTAEEFKKIQDVLAKHNQNLEIVIFNLENSIAKLHEIETRH